MDVKYSRPVAGTSFNIDVKIGNRWAQLNVYLDEYKLLERRFDCPDPPCHERITLELKSDSKGKQLIIRGEDPDGQPTWRTRVE
jgi:hypothetical protein